MQFTTETRTKIMKFLKLKLAQHKLWSREEVCDMQCDEDFDSKEESYLGLHQVYEDKNIEIRTEIQIEQKHDDTEAGVSLEVFYSLKFGKKRSEFSYKRDWTYVIYTKVGGICVDELLPYESGIELFQRKLAMVKELHLCKECNESVNTYFLDIDGLCEDCYMEQP